MAATSPRPDPSSPAAIAAATFSSARKGYDPSEVRPFLEAVARRLTEAQDEVARLRSEAQQGGTFDEAAAMALLGEETTRVLRTARESAAAVQAQAAEGAARLLREAQDDASRLRHEVEVESVQQRQDAAEAAAAEREAAAVAASRQRADAAADAERVRAEARADAEAEVTAAKEQAREMLAETRAVRERMLADLARRRDAGRSQLEQLDAARGRIAAAFEGARHALDDALTDIDDAFLVEHDQPDALSVASVAGEVAGLEVLDAAADDLPVPPAADEVADGADSELAAPVDVSEHVDAAADAPDAPHDGDEAVDDLFARLRANRTDDVVAQVAVTVDEPADEELPPDRWAARAAALAPLTAALARSLKRTLSDEQSDVLDRLRRHAKGVGLDALVGPVAEHAERYQVAARDHLAQAAEFGARALGGGDVGEAVVQAALDAVTSDVVLPLRERLERSLEQADGDTVEAASLLRAGYREWKTQRLDALAADLVHVAEGRGAFAAVATGTPVCWLVDPAAAPCPDADDNALAGAVAAGTPFPTGHLAPPAHPGCRCLLTKVDG